MTRKTNKRRITRASANRNRLWDTRQHTFAFTGKGSAFIVVAVIAAIVPLVLKHANESIYDEIKAEESRQSALMEEYSHENVKWSRMKTPAQITSALARHGIKMNRPRSSQCIAMHTIRTGGAVTAANTAFASLR